MYIAPSRATYKALRHESHSFTCKLHHACLYLVSIHQMELPLTGDSVRLIAAYYSSIDPKRLSWPSWLTYSWQFTHLRDHPSAAGRVQDMESSLVKDQRSTTVPCNQPVSVVDWRCNFCHAAHESKTLVRCRSAICVAECCSCWVSVSITVHPARYKWMPSV